VGERDAESERERVNISLKYTSIYTHRQMYVIYTRNKCIYIYDNTYTHLYKCIDTVETERERFVWEGGVGGWGGAIHTYVAAFMFVGIRGHISGD
jgi:hypothetical protein